MEKKGGALKRPRKKPTQHKFENKGGSLKCKKNGEIKIENHKGYRGSKGPVGDQQRRGNNSTKGERQKRKNEDASCESGKKGTL